MHSVRRSVSQEKYFLGAFALAQQHPLQPLRPHDDIEDEVREGDGGERETAIDDEDDRERRSFAMPMPTGLRRPLERLGIFAAHSPFVNTHTACSFLKKSA